MILINREQSAAVIIAAAARAVIRALGMHAENMQRIHRGESAAYDEQAFARIIISEGLGSHSISEIINMAD